MSLKSFRSRPGLVAASILSAAAVGALASPLHALAADVSGVAITSQAPTSVTVTLVGKTRHQVLRDIRTAAHVVCRNAYLNGDLGAYAEAYSECPDRATDVAYDRYQAILRSNPEVAVATLSIAPPGAPR